MSAMFVSKHNIDLLVSAMRELRSHVRLEGRHDRADRLDPNDLGKRLWSENVKSLRFRYPTDRDDHRDFDAKSGPIPSPNIPTSSRARSDASPTSMTIRPVSIRLGATAMRSSPSANCEWNW
jgi:hypothetical protein